MICEIWITYYIKRTEYPLGLSQKSGLRRILFDRSCLRRIFFNKKSALRRILFMQSLLKPRCIWFEVSYYVYQFIGGENDSNSNTEWSQRHSLYQTVIRQVSNNKPFVKSNPLEIQITQHHFNSKTVDKKQRTAAGKCSGGRINLLIQINSEPKILRSCFLHCTSPYPSSSNSLSCIVCTYIFCDVFDI